MATGRVRQFHIRDFKQERLVIVTRHLYNYSIYFRLAYVLSSAFKDKLTQDNVATHKLLVCLQFASGGNFSGGGGGAITIRLL